MPGAWCLRGRIKGGGAMGEGRLVSDLRVMDGDSNSTPGEEVRVPSVEGDR